VCKLVIDASVLISWCDELSDRVIFEKLMDSGYSIVVPERVEEEVSGESELYQDILSSCEVVQCDEEVYQKLNSRYVRLGSGELAVLTIGKGLEKQGEGYFCLLDDRRARDICRKIDLELKGTIGTLGLLVREGQIKLSEADSILSQMKESGTRLPKNYEELLRETIE